MYCERLSTDLEALHHTTVTDSLLDQISTLKDEIKARIFDQKGLHFAESIWDLFQRGDACASQNSLCEPYLEIVRNVSQINPIVV